MLFAFFISIKLNSVDQKIENSDLLINLFHYLLALISKHFCNLYDLKNE